MTVSIDLDYGYVCKCISLHVYVYIVAMFTGVVIYIPICNMIFVQTNNTGPSCHEFFDYCIRLMSFSETCCLYSHCQRGF